MRSEYKLDPFTFGGYKASELLVKELDKVNDRGISGRVCKSLDSFFIKIKALSMLKSERGYFLSLYTRKAKDDILNDNTIPYKVGSYCSNIMTSRFNEIR